MMYSLFHWRLFFFVFFSFFSFFFFFSFPFFHQTTTQDVIHIIGKNFGSSIVYLESMTYGCAGSGNQWSFDITKSCTLVKEHTEFVCTTAPGGKWHHSGKSSKGKPIYEIWSKRVDLGI